MLSTPSGMFICKREEHFSKAQLPMVLIPSGMVTSVIDEQPENALSAITFVSALISYLPVWFLLTSIRELFKYNV